MEAAERLEVLEREHIAVLHELGAVKAELKKLREGAKQ